jgi:aspartate-semialdehyde dehydrogenase
MAKQKIRVAVVGATGVAGQQFMAALARHPQMQVAKLAASTRSAGRTYAEAITTPAGQLSWYCDQPLDPHLAALQVEDAEELDVREIDLVFSCVESEPARRLEPRYAEHCPVISSASAFRYEADVPLLLPGVNLDHTQVLARQRAQRGWKGFIAPNPNCTTVGLAITLAPLHRAFGVKKVYMTSLQAVSGAGRSPGVIALDVVDNVIPYIPGEEEKVERETQKILGTWDGEGIRPADFTVSCTCTRIAVLEGHTESVFVQLERPATASELRAAWREFATDITAAGYPSAPEHLIEVSEDPFRPQVRLDRDRGEGMTTVVGRVRPDGHGPSDSGHNWKYVLVSHNTKMGAAKGCLLMAEYLIQKGFIG